jgi:hypothetical protein
MMMMMIAEGCSAIVFMSHGAEATPTMMITMLRMMMMMMLLLWVSLLDIGQ